MIQMLGSSSTRNNVKQSQKNINSARFFKKLSTTDQNQKNLVNYVDRLLPHKNMMINAHASTGALNSLKNASIKKNNRKKSINNLTSLSGKNLKTIDSIGSIITSTRNLDNKDGKQKGFKNLKLTSSIQFPKILCKSVSQTTINKRTDQRTLKLLQKIGGQKKTAYIKKKSSCFLVSPELKINQFRLGKKLGSGRFGSVYLAQDKQSKLLYAIKVLNKLKIKQAKMQQQIIMQIKLQSYMNHPNILKMYGYFSDSKNIYLILQYCSQCLFKDFRSKGKLSQEQTAYYGKQAISALKYMHNQYIMHRDIKPQNILLQHGVLKLSDFGWSTYSPLYKRQTFCGTIDYVPPQIVQGSSYDQKVDIWALGVLIYELASGKAPFQTRDQNNTYDKILHSQCKYPHHFSQEIVRLLKKILDKNPSNRPDLDQIEQHHWFQTYKTIGRYIAKPIWTAWNNL